MGRNGQLVRQWKILQCLATHRFGRSIGDLAADFLVSTRTIRRDLQCLEEAGFPVFDFETESGSKWKVESKAMGRLFSMDGFLMKKED